MARVPTPTLHANPAIPFVVAVLGIASFSVMDAAMKGLVLAIGAYTAVFWRNVIGGVMGAVLYFGQGGTLPGPAALRLHAKRSAVVAGMAILFFWALGRLPLAEAIGLSFFAPVFALFLAAILLGEKIGKEALISSATGVAGVAVMIAGRLTGEYDATALWGIAAVMGSALLYAWNLILARQQAQIATPQEIAFFQASLTALFLLPASPWLLLPVAAGHWPMLLLSACLAMTALLLLSWAYARAEAQYLIPVEYTGFLWAALLGWLFFDEAVLWPTIAGTCLIVAGSIVAARAKPKIIVQPTEIA